MECKIGIGIDNIIFGMSQKEIKNILGDPDRCSETEKENGIVYTYNDKMIKLKFDKNENSKLYSIEIHNQEILLFGQNIIDRSRNYIYNLLTANGYKNIEYTDYDFFETLFCREIWTTFSFRFDRLISIEYSPLSNIDNIIIWPNKS